MLLTNGGRGLNTCPHHAKGEGLSPAAVTQGEKKAKKCGCVITTVIIIYLDNLCRDKAPTQRILSQNFRMEFSESFQ